MGHAIVAGGARASVPVTGIRLGDIAEGSIVKLNENGSPVEFYVAKHDYESALNGAGRTLLVRKECYDSRPWDSSSANAYATSTIDSWLNGAYKNLLDSKTQSAIGSTIFYYTPGNGTTTVTTISRSVFLLSLKEFGKAGQYANVEGSALPIASILQKATLNGKVVIQWTRSPYKNGTNGVYFLATGGGAQSTVCTSEEYSRPCFTLPSGALFDKNTLILKGVA